jgi:hypothetical protein
MRRLYCTGLATVELSTKAAASSSRAVGVAVARVTPR